MAELFQEKEVTATKKPGTQTRNLVASLLEQYGAASTGVGAFKTTLLEDLDRYERFLKDAYQTFRDATNQELALSYASEWLLDNYYIVREAIREIGEDLPPGFYRQLPILEKGSMKGLPRIYAVTSALLAHQKLRIDVPGFLDVLNEFQEQVPFTMGELWAFPTFLRFGLVEVLSHSLETLLLEARVKNDLPSQEVSRAGRVNLTGEDGASADAVRGAILGLRSIGEQNWKDFFEASSRVEQTMRLDPTGVYPQMDFATRDHYRKVVEEIALHSGLGELQVATSALNLAEETARSHQINTTAAPPGHLEWNERIEHIGYYLIAEGRAQLEDRLGYKPGWLGTLAGTLRKNATVVYIGSILLVALLLLLISWVSFPSSVTTAERILIHLLLVIPTITITTSMATWLITMLIPPNTLPKIEYKDGPPDDRRAVVAVPTLISSQKEIDSLALQLEMHYLRNPGPGLRFALLADLADADQETLPEDEELINHSSAVIKALNEKYAPQAGYAPFYLLLRKRLKNDAENKWMGWERKRGKLHQFNKLLLGIKQGKPFTHVTGDLDSLVGTPYVITLDADTILPPGAARRMVGTMAHPLNRAVFQSDPAHPSVQRVTAGYTVLQPRMEISPTSANRTWFTRIFAGDTGLDLYTLAVSDAYQDLFHEGIYVGKGVYDVAAFDRSVDDHIPENTLLSHDLLEGLLGRAGLVTDVTMIEDYPPNFFTQAFRQHRWIRGDWQLLPWLLQPGRFHIFLSAIDRWKIIDNLRRSLLAPNLLLLFVLGLLIAPTWALFWTAVVLLTLSFPMLQSITRSGLRLVGGERPLVALRPASWDLLRWLLAVAYLPHDALLTMDAVVRTLYRVFISRRNMLEWTTAANTARMFKQENPLVVTWQRMLPGLLLGVGLAGWLFWAAPSGLANAAPVLLLWIFAPQITLMLNQPAVRQETPLSEDELAYLRRITRRTWAFFERFAGPEDHWLPPDHYQEYPVGMVAHRTSPTNIGLLLTSSLAAFDLGYLDILGLSARLAATFDTLERLERQRGHFLNWYDTVTLQPLTPRYISTVDSGNLAACFIVTAQACYAMHHAPIFRWELWQGYLDSLFMLSDQLSQWAPAEEKHDGSQTASPDGSVFVRNAQEQIEAMSVRIRAAQNHPEQWYPLFQAASGPFWQELSGCLTELVTSQTPTAGVDLLNALGEVANQIERQHTTVQRTINELVPWIPLLESPPEALSDPYFGEAFLALQQSLPYAPTLDEIRALAEPARQKIDALRELVSQNGAVSSRISSNAQPEISAWLDSLEQEMDRAVGRAGALQSGFQIIARQAEAYFREMDFASLYHEQRGIFHIGYNVDAGQLDSNYYDLLASEARIASFLAIARGEVPQKHWLQLGRPITSVGGQRVLLSWSATMFEYLMPPLFLRTYPRTLLDESARGAIDHQIEYARSKNVPWGISESGFYRVDASFNYQYRAFGVPGLGFKRGLADDLVIAPYASLMAVGIAPRAVYQNLLRLEQLGAVGLYGAYEAIDFTKDRLLIGEKHALVREYMSHHHGMVMMAMANFFKDNIMVRRMHSASFVQSAALLLQEQIPISAPLQNPTTGTVKGIQRIEPARVELTPWSVPVQTPIPQLHLLSNGDYNVMISNTGSGYSAWRGIDLTRWQPDRALDMDGTWLYLQELNSADGEPADNLTPPWSATFQPIPGNPAAHQVTYFAHMAVYQRTENGITTTVEVTVAPDDPVEIRHMHINNGTNQFRRLRLTTYGEVILTQQASDSRHPAFNKLFIENEWDEEHKLQIFHRRKRSASEKSIYCGHMLVLNDIDGIDSYGAHEANRSEFIGRLRSQRNPQVLDSGRTLTGSSGATLDPIFALSVEIHLPPHSSAQLACLTFASDSRKTLIGLAQRYHNWDIIERSFHQADLIAQSLASQQHLSSDALKTILQAFSALVYPFRVTRAPAEILSANQLGQPGLWRFGISGDYPIMLVQIDDPEQMELVREALQAHRHLVSRRVLVDLVILNRQQTDYGAEMNGMLYRLVSRVNSEQWLNQRGGIFILYADQMQPEELVLLQTSARLLLPGEHGSLEQQVPGYAIQVPHLPEFVPTRPLTVEEPYVQPPAVASELGDFFNGYGAFSPDGREYVIDLPPGRVTPAPWVNVIGYPEFGFLVTESGSQTTWAINSGENRLTPWSNDPVRDTTGEALYLRDEETGAVWTPTPHPAGSNLPYRVRHGAGYTIFEHESHGLEQRLTIFASPEDPVKIIHLSVKNTWDQPRRITATQYVEWVLGTTHQASLQYIIPEFDPTQGCLLAANPFNAEFGKRTAFLGASKPIHSLTTDRIEFIGRNGSMRNPVGLRRIGLDSNISPGEDPCAVLQVHLDLPPGGSEEIYFTLGQGTDRGHSLALAAKYREPGAVDAAWQRTQAFWDRLLDTIQVNLPDKAMQRILNRWMLYQTLSCRVWGRSGFYQSSGAFGFRDQLQDVLGLMFIDPSITRGQILNAAHHQFEEGDVLHWWHPPSGRGVRTRFSDDLLWLPFVTAQYVEATGDWAILEEQIPFRHGELLKQGEDERYGVYPFGGQTASLYEHCRRAIEKGATRGQNGLPLIGTGDWNDGFSKVGEKGRGESVWLAWFLIDVLNRFAVVCEQRDEMGQAEQYRELGREYARAVETTAWDGQWYRRAYYDNGATMGSAGDLECQIDAIAQSWAVLSEAGEPSRSKQAMQSVLDRLVRPEDRLVLLFTPPFNKTPQNPGYIKGYLPGIRENGGQYTHAAIWTNWAVAKLGDGNRAGELFSLLNPILQADTQEKSDVYRVEPYVICADIYSVEPYLRRGGWTWYTGSASWMYRLGIEGLLGFRREGDKLRVDPVIPPEWDGFSITYCFGTSKYHIRVKNPHHIARGEPNPSIPLVDDGQEHTVEIVLQP